MLSVIASILSILGNFLVNKKNRLGFVIWCISNTYWIYLALTIKNYPQSIMFLVYSVLNVHGFIKWGKDDKSIKK